MNNRTVLVLEEGGKETPVPWRDLAVGDIVKVRQGVVAAGQGGHKGARVVTALGNAGGG